MQLSNSYPAYAVWGTKRGKQTFHSVGVDLSIKKLDALLKDVRTPVQFVKVPNLVFYSLTFIENVAVYTAYRTIYDWTDRAGYYAVSLFIDQGKTIGNGVDTYELLNQLLDEYYTLAVETSKISHQIKRNINEQEVEGKLRILIENPAFPLEDLMPAKKAGGKHSEEVQITFDTEEEVTTLFENAWHRAIKDYQAIYLLPSADSRISSELPVIGMPAFSQDDQQAIPPTTDPVDQEDKEAEAAAEAERQRKAEEKRKKEQEKQKQQEKEAQEQRDKAEREQKEEEERQEEERKKQAAKKKKLFFIAGGGVLTLLAIVLVYFTLFHETKLDYPYEIKQKAILDAAKKEDLSVALTALETLSKEIQEANADSFNIDETKHQQLITNIVEKANAIQEKIARAKEKEKKELVGNVERLIASTDFNLESANKYLQIDSTSEGILTPELKNNLVLYRDVCKRVRFCKAIIRDIPNKRGEAEENYTILKDILKIEKYKFLAREVKTELEFYKSTMKTIDKNSWVKDKEGILKIAQGNGIARMNEFKNFFAGQGL